VIHTLIIEFFSHGLRSVKIEQELEKTLSCWVFFVSLSSLCFATDEDARAVENFCNTLFKCVYNLHEEIFRLIVD
jgi:hypothetical protein